MINHPSQSNFSLSKQLLSLSPFHVMLLSTHSLDPCLWRESDHPAFGTPGSLSLHLTCSSIIPAESVHKSRGDNVVRMCSQRDDLCRVCGCYRECLVVNEFDLASTVCKYDLRKGDLFVLSWAMVRRVRRGCISWELLMCGVCVRSILLLSLVARCLEIKDVCLRRMLVFMSVVVAVWGLWECSCVAAVVENDFLSLECFSMLCVCVADMMDVVFSVCNVRRGAVGACEWEVCFVMQLLYVCVLCASCVSSQCCVLHDLQFVDAGRR